MSQTVRQLICIDLDGPILDVSERYYQVYCDCLRLIGAPPLDKESYWELKRGKISEPDILKQTGAQRSDLIQAYIDARNKRIEVDDYLQFDQVWPGIPETLKLLRAGRTLTLVTMRISKELLEQQLKRLKLRDSFDCVLSAGAELGANTRGERKALLVRDCYENEEFTGWFVGDTETDVQSGRLLGLRSAAITFGIRTVEHLNSVSPDVMLHKPAEFQNWARTLG